MILKSGGARRPPIKSAATMKPTDTAMFTPTPASDTLAPAATPLTTASMMSPTTSSRTAAPSTTCPSGVSSCPRSERTRAEIPMDVAVSAAPHTIEGTAGNPMRLATQ